MAVRCKESALQPHKRLLTGAGVVPGAVCRVRRSSPGGSAVSLTGRHPAPAPSAAQARSTRAARPMVVHQNEPVAATPLSPMPRPSPRR